MADDNNNTDDIDDDAEMLFGLFMWSVECGVCNAGEKKKERVIMIHSGTETKSRDE